jgi:rhodanese-related sulfurtransferase
LVVYWRNKFWWIPFGNVPEISPNELYQKLVGDSAPHLLDVRTHRDWIASRIEGAVNVPITSFRAEAAEFPLHGCRHPLPVPVPFARQREVGL